MLIRTEEPGDFDIVRELVRLSFKDMEESDHTEHLLVDRIRRSDAYIPALSLVAEVPGFQRKGIGGRLLLEAHRRAAEAGYRGALLLGHKDYYPRFGYRRASLFGIRFPFDAPDECCMAVEFRPGSLDGVHGEVRYPSVFFE